MKLTMNTVKLQDMVSRAVKGASNNKLIPITSLMAIELNANHILTLTTTDATNYLYIDEHKVDGDEFYAVVPVDVFSKLIARMTCENVTLTVHPEIKILEVKGNGNYKIELPLDENGHLIKYPNPYKSDENFGNKLNLSTVKVILDTLKSALATTLENPCYTGYYVGDSVIATDTYKIANMDVSLFDEPVLVSAELMNLLSVITEENIKVSIDGDVLQFATDTCRIYGREMEGIEDFAVEPIMSLVNTEMDSQCSLNKTQLLQVLDRLSLFVGPYDKNAVRFTFTREGLEISSKASSSVEMIPYISSEDFREFTCMIDVQMITQEVKAVQTDAIEMYYGEDNAVIMKDGNITIVVALLEDEDE